MSVLTLKLELVMETSAAGPSTLSDLSSTVSSREGVSEVSTARETSGDASLISGDSSFTEDGEPSLVEAPSAAKAATLAAKSFLISPLGLLGAAALASELDSGAGVELVELGSVAGVAAGVGV